jgi:hypothetical protein
MVFANLELRALVYLRRIGRIPILVGIGALAGIGTRLLVDGWQSAPLRLVTIGGAVIVVSFVLLGTFEQYSPRAIIRSLRA